MFIIYYLILLIFIIKFIILILIVDFKVEIFIIFYKYILNGENIFYNFNVKYI